MEKIEIYEVGTVLDTVTSTKEQQGIMALLKKNKNIALDLSHCTYVSSAGLRVMLCTFKTAKAQGGRIDLVGVSNEIRDVMSMTGFDKFFKFYQTIEECINQ